MKSRTRARKASSPSSPPSAAVAAVAAARRVALGDQPPALAPRLRAPRNLAQHAALVSGARLARRVRCVSARGGPAARGPEPDPAGAVLRWVAGEQLRGTARVPRQERRARGQKRPRASAPPRRRRRRRRRRGKVARGANGRKVAVPPPRGAPPRLLLGETLSRRARPRMLSERRPYERSASVRAAIATVAIEEYAV
jgi:hypothetical protein